jgi:hypothetical protein
LIVPPRTLHTIGSAKYVTIATGEFSSMAPKARPIRTKTTWSSRLCQISEPAVLQLPSPPSALPSTFAAAASTSVAAVEAPAIRMPASSFAAITRSRAGTRVNVVSAVRCDHSAVIDRIPRMGSSTAEGSTPKAKKPVNVSSSSGDQPSWTAEVPTVASPMMISSQSPARVSASLRNSITVSRVSGIGWALARRTSGVGVCRTAVIGRPP